MCTFISPCQEKPDVIAWRAGPTVCLGVAQDNYLLRQSLIWSPSAGLGKLNHRAHRETVFTLTALLDLQLLLILKSVCRFFPALPQQYHMLTPGCSSTNIQPFYRWHQWSSVGNICLSTHMLGIALEGRESVINSTIISKPGNFVNISVQSPLWC